MIRSIRRGSSLILHKVRKLCGWTMPVRSKSHDGAIGVAQFVSPADSHAIGVVAIAVEVALVVLIVGLTSGLLQETAKRIEGIGADVMLQPPAASVFIGMTGAPMPIKIGDKLAELKYVQAVAPTLLQFSSSGGVDVVYGIDSDSFRA